MLATTPPPLKCRKQHEAGKVRSSYLQKASEAKRRGYSTRGFVVEWRIIVVNTALAIQDQWGATRRGTRAAVPSGR